MSDTFSNSETVPSVVSVCLLNLFLPLVSFVQVSLVSSPPEYHTFRVLVSFPRGNKFTDLSFL